MFGLKTIRTKELDALREEIKGYYAAEETFNEYMNIISPQLRGTQLEGLEGLSREEMKNAYETIAPVMGVVNYIADNVGEISRYVDLMDRRSGKFIEHHWLLDLLDNPNDRFTRRKFFAAWAVNKCVFGDAFTYAPVEPGAKRQVRRMYVIPGQRVLVDKGGLEAPFKGIRLKNGLNEELELTNKVFESFDYNLDDSNFFGTSKIATAAVYLTVMDRAMKRQATTLKNGGPANIVTPAAGATVPALPQQIDDMEQKMNKPSAANKNLAMKMAIEVHSLGDKPVDLGILDSHDEAINVLCFLFKVPVDIYKGQAKYENAKEAKKTIYEQIAIPMVNEFCEDLIHYLKLDKDYELAVNTDEIEVLRESRSDVLDCLGKMHASLNELREANGYEALKEDWADKPILPLGVQFGDESFDISEE